MPDRSQEVHLLPTFAADFYGAPLRLRICGFIRPERNYDGVEALVADIRTDIDVARRSLARLAWATLAEDPWLVEGFVEWTAGEGPSEGEAVKGAETS